MRRHATAEGGVEVGRFRRAPPADPLGDGDGASADEAQAAEEEGEEGEEGEEEEERWRDGASIGPEDDDALPNLPKEVCEMDDDDGEEGLD